MTPPITPTIPKRLISPVIAILLFTGLFNIALYIAVAIAIPADGPSTGIPPGIFICISYSSHFKLYILFNAVNTFCIDEKAVLFLFIFLLFIENSSSSTIPETLSSPFLPFIFLAVTSISIRIPKLAPYTANPFTTPTIGFFDTFFSSTSVYCPFSITHLISSSVI